MTRRNAKNLIRQALLSLLEEKALDEIDVQDIAAKAELSRQTFYYNFKNKRDLIDWILGCNADLAQAAFRTSHDINTYICVAFSEAAKDKALYKNLSALEEGSYTQLLRDGVLSCAQLMMNLTERQIVDSDLNEALLVFKCSAGGLMQHWVENGMRQSPQQMANMLCANMPYLAANFFHYNHKEHLAKEDLL
ncbi:MAG: TetR family transcriptional regulator [Firmicutes bacterium]|nr:TetR family transcriptional regulator [Bacillota bacterium]